MKQTQVEQPKKSEINAADILSEEHPVNKHFVKWLGDKKATKRQARKFLQQFPQYRG